MAALADVAVGFGAALGKSCVKFCGIAAQFAAWKGSDELDEEVRVHSGIKALEIQLTQE